MLWQCYSEKRISGLKRRCAKMLQLCLCVCSVCVCVICALVMRAREQLWEAEAWVPLSRLQRRGGIMLNAPFLTPHYIPLSPFWTIYNSNLNRYSAHRSFITQSNSVWSPSPPILDHDFCKQVLQQGYQSIIFYCEWYKKAFQAGKAVPSRC